MSDSNSTSTGIDSHVEVCPSCGSCPTCGRRDRPVTYPINPIYPLPYMQPYNPYPFPYGGYPQVWC